MSVTSNDPKPSQSLRYFSAYAWYLFFILLCVAIIFALRSDIYILCIVFAAPKDITQFIYAWSVYPLFLPFILVVAGLEPYMNRAAQRNEVRQRALKVLAVEAGIGLLALVVMGILALMGYPPTL